MVQDNRSGYPEPVFFGDSSITLDSTRSDSLFALNQSLKKGQTLYEKNCQKCHELHNPGDYSIKEWKENLDEMKEKAGLKKKEYELILSYLSAYSKK